MTEPERRHEVVSESDTKAIWELLREVEQKIDTHLTEENLYRPQLLEAIEVMQNTKGVLAFLRGLVYFLVPLGALFAWLKDHLK